MRALLLSSVMTFAPCVALADPQCVISPVVSHSAAISTSQPTAAKPPTSTQFASPTNESDNGRLRLLIDRISAPVLDHVVAAGANLTEVDTSHGLRAVIARNNGQFMRLYVSPDGQAVVAGLMAELSPDELLAMAPGQVTELGTLHGLRGIFVRNAGQFQVFYASPDDERVIPGAMFDAQGKNLTLDQVAAIPGTVPTEPRRVCWRRVGLSATRLRACRPAWRSGWLPLRPAGCCRWARAAACC